MTHNETQAAPARFELSGGPLCLDFANSWGNQGDPGTDRLGDYEHLVEFGSQTGRLTAEEAASLSRAAAGDREKAAAALSLGRDLRQIIYRLFSSRAGGREIPLEDVERINALLGEAFARRRISPLDGGFEWSWAEADGQDLRAPLWPVIESAAALLTSDGLARVRECDATDCTWLFLDRSRSGTRRWCSMSSCGNRAKARRHYHRQGKGRAS